MKQPELVCRGQQREWALPSKSLTGSATAGAHLEKALLERNTIKCHAVRSLFHAAELHKCIIFVLLHHPARQQLSSYSIRASTMVILGAAVNPCRYVRCAFVSILIGSKPILPVAPPLLVLMLLCRVWTDGAECKLKMLQLTLCRHWLHDE